MLEAPRIHTGAMSWDRRNFARRQVHDAVTALARKNWLVLAGVCGMAGVALLLQSVLMNGYVLGLVQGLSVGLMGFMIAMTLLLVSGTTLQLSGAWGEDNTRDELRWATRRSLVYGAVHGLEIKSGDVDHLVATPGGLVVIDSKWHSHGIDQATVQRDTRAAQRSAARARSILRSLGHRMDVATVVVIWGKDQHLLEAPRVVGGVTFVAGRQLRTWLRGQAAGTTLDRTTGTAIMQKLHRFRNEVDPHRAKPGIPRERGRRSARPRAA